jgi:hypothetical protein
MYNKLVTEILRKVMRAQYKINFDHPLYKKPSWRLIISPEKYLQTNTNRNLKYT